MTRVGIVPAAGHATRLGLENGSKEVQQVRGRPVLEYLFERMILVPVDRIRVVIRPEKQDVAEAASRLGAELVVGHPPSATASFALGLEGLEASDTVVFGFPDTIWTPEDGFVPLVRMVESGEDVALGVFESPYPERSDVAILSPDGRISRIDVKPGRARSDRVWACGAATVSAFSRLTANEELGRALSQRALRDPIAAVELGRVIDIGTPEAWRSAASDPVFE